MSAEQSALEKQVADLIGQRAHGLAGIAMGALEDFGMGNAIIIAVGEKDGERNNGVGPLAIVTVFSSHGVRDDDVRAFKAAFEQMVQDVKGKPPAYNVVNVNNLKPLFEQEGGEL